MRRWVLAPDSQLDADKVKHLRKVLRMEWGEPVLATDGAGKLNEAVLEKSGDRGVLRLGALVREEAAPAPVELAVCLPKNATMDWVVEKSVECGVTRIVPVVSSRSVVRPKPDESVKYVRRWQAIMDGAVEQSERLWRPEVSAPLAWRDWVARLEARAEAARKIAFVSELREARGDAEALDATWTALRKPGPAPVFLVIGPEGGMAEEERSELSGLGFEELSLGRTVLRVETAVIAALTLVRLSRCIATHV
jgi:16S rRNA (uracil1498-N3)-methyltransferase